MNKLFTEEWAFVGGVDPDSVSTGTQLTAAIDMALWEQLCAVVYVGDKGAGTAITGAFQSAATSGGSYVAISGKAMTSFGDQSPVANGSNRVFFVNLRGSEVTDNNRYVKFASTLTPGSPTAASDITVLVFGRGRHQPADDNDASAVAEIVN